MLFIFARFGQCLNNLMLFSFVGFAQCLKNSTHISDSPANLSPKERVVFENKI
jgi:hypothetical protein